MADIAVLDASAKSCLGSTRLLVVFRTAYSHPLPVYLITSSSRSFAPVALVDWNSSGHHEMYLRAYSEAFLRLGRPVLVLSADRGAGERIQASHPGQVVAAEIPGVDWIKRRRWFTRRLANRFFARRVAQALATGECALGEKCDRLFLGCLYESQSRVAMAVLNELGRDAAGLYLQPGVFYTGGGRPSGRRAAEMMALLKHPSLRRVLVLDEEMVGPVAGAAGKKVSLAPDFADATEPEAGGGEREAVRPAYRGTVSLLGHLRPTKGVGLMARLAVTRPDLKVRFLFAGEFRASAFSEEDRRWIERARSLQGRVEFRAGKIKSEAAYNALVRDSSVLWAVYPGVPHSSNTLTKAALFERPVLVADGHLMARQTRDYRLGEVVDSENLDEMARTLGRLLNDRERWVSTARPRWAEFRELQSEARLAPLLSDWLKS